MKGFKIRLRRLSMDEEFVQNLIVNEEYNPAGYEIRGYDTVIDTGANIGVFSLLAARRAAGGRVFAFEPVDVNYRMLMTNLHINRISNVTAKKNAILDKRTHVKIYLSDERNKTGCHSVFTRHVADPSRSFESVEAIPLKDVFDEYDIDRCNFLKVDCEGSEYQILHALPTEYFRRIERIVLEYLATTSNGEDLPAKPNRLVRHLQHEGYRIDAYLRTALGGFIRARRV